MRKCVYVTGLLPDTENCGLCMRQECRERFPRHRLQRKPLVSDPGMHHGTCFTHVPWCMSGSLTRGGGGKVPGISGACATRNFTHLVRGPWRHHSTNGFDTELPRVYDSVYSTDVNLTQCSDVIKSAMASQITDISSVCSTVSSGTDQRKLRVTGLREGNPLVTGGIRTERMCLKFQCSMNKGQWCFKSPIMHAPNKFEVNGMNALFENVWKP